MFRLSVIIEEIDPWSFGSTILPIRKEELQRKDKLIPKPGTIELNSCHFVPCSRNKTQNFKPLFSVHNPLETNTLNSRTPKETIFFPRYKLFAFSRRSKFTNLKNSKRSEKFRYPALETKLVKFLRTFVLYSRSTRTLEFRFTRGHRAETPMFLSPDAESVARFWFP